MAKLNRIAGIEYPHDAKLQARIRSYELAFEMQTAVPQVMDFSSESKSIRSMYGLEEAKTKPFGEKLLAAYVVVHAGAEHERERVDRRAGDPR